MEPKGKRERLKKFHRNNILEIAKNLFAIKGVAQTTMDDIAKEGEYSKSTLYSYFKSKDVIFSYIVYENSLFLKEAIDRARQHDSVKDAFMDICQAHVHFQEKHPLYFESLIGRITEPKDGTEPIYKDIYELNEQINQSVVEFLEDGIKRNEVKPSIDTLQTAFVLWAGICGLIMMAYNKQAYLNCMNVSKEEFLANGFQTYLNSILTSKMVLKEGKP